MGKMFSAKRDRGQANRIERRGLMDALDASQSLVWFDGAGMVVDANSNALEMFGFSDSEILKQDYFSLCRRDAQASMADKREWQRISGGEMVHTERSFWRKDGQEVWASVNFAAIRNDAGKTRRVMALFIDLNRFAWKPNDVRRVC